MHIELVSNYLQVFSSIYKGDERWQNIGVIVTAKDIKKNEKVCDTLDE